MRLFPLSSLSVLVLFVCAGVNVSMLAEKIAAAGVPSKGTFPSQYSISDISPIGPSSVRGLFPSRVGTWWIPVVTMLTSFPFTKVLGSKSAAGSSGKPSLLSSSWSGISMGTLASLRVLICWSQGLPNTGFG